MQMPRRKEPCDRRFTMRDAMILIAAAGVGFAILDPLQAGPLKDLPRWTLYLTYYILGLLTLTPAALALRLIGPRPPMHRLTRQPGFAASVAGSAIVALGLLAVGIVALINLVKSDLVSSGGKPLVMPQPLWWWPWIVRYFGPFVGPAIIATWVMLALSGRRRPVASWLDYLGRGLGTGWIILFVIHACTQLSHLID